MFNHVAKYDWRLHYDGSRPSLLGAARRKNPHLLARDDESDDDIVRSAKTDQEMRAHLQTRPTGDETAEANLLNKVVESWRADNAAGGVGVHAHLPLPKPFAAVLARLLGDVGETERTPIFDDLIRKFEPSVRTLVAQQIAGQMNQRSPYGPHLRIGEEAGGEVGNRSGFAREFIRDAAAEGAPWLQLRPGERPSLGAARLAVDDADEVEARSSKRPLVRSLISESERDEPILSRATELRPEDAGRYQDFAGSSQGERVRGTNTSAARQQGSPYNPKVDDLAKDLQYFGYDPALLSKNMPGWRPILLFDDRVPEGYNSSQIAGGMIRLNRKGFGGYLAHRKGSRDFAFMVKGMEVSEGRQNDVLANDDAGADQVAEVAEDVFQQCKALGVFDAIKGGGSLTIVGHSQGAPSAQLLGVYLIVRALNEKPPLLTEAQALAAIKVRGFGGIGARDYLDRLRGPDGKRLNVPQSVLDRIDAVTYIISGDPLAQRAATQYIGSAYLVDRPDPNSYRPTEPWARGSGELLAPHARSAYKAADYRTARRYKPLTTKGALGDAIGGVADVFGGLVDDVTDWWY